MADKNQPGNGPVEPEYVAIMNSAALTLDALFNRGLKGRQRTVGFVLLVFPFGEKEARCDFVSNADNRKLIAEILREQANSLDESTMQSLQEGFMVEEFPSFVTVLGHRDKFYAAVMVWDRHHERYDLGRGFAKGKKRKVKAEAVTDAAEIAFHWGLELRINQLEGIVQ